MGLGLAGWLRIVAGIIAAALFALILVWFNSTIETTAAVQVEAGPDARPNLDQPVVCQAISGRGRTDSVVTEPGSTEQVSPLYGDTADVTRRCSDARSSQGTKMLVWAIPTITLAVAAVTHRGRTT